MWLARKSALGMVASQMIPVDPKGDQPPYIRSKHTFAKSAKLIRYRTCVADAMSGKKFDNRAEVRAAFTEAARDCS